MLSEESRALLRLIEESGAAPIHHVTPQEARERAAGLLALTGTPEPVDHVREATIPVRAGASIAARLYSHSTAEPAPLIVYFHGGGWIQGSLDSADAACRKLCNQSQMAVLSVEYRLAPEHNFPLPLNDAWDATVWAAEQHEFLGGDGTLIVAGDSAGGNFAAVVAQLARDEGGPPISHQLLVYPVLDHDFSTPSYQEVTEGVLVRETMEYFWGHYLADPSHGASPLASPLRAATLDNLPAATIVLADEDPLRDEGRAYAEKLRASGNNVELLEYPGTIHGFWSLLGALPTGNQAIADAGARLRAAVTGATA